MNAHTSVVAMATAQQAANRPSDDQVIAWLGERNVAGPFDADFIEEMRTHIEGADFVARVRDIRKDPEKLALFLNELATVGAVDLADAIAQLDQPGDDAEEPADLDTLIKRWERASAEAGEFEKRVLKPAQKRLEKASKAIPPVYATYQSMAGPHTWCSTTPYDVKRAYDFLGIWEVDSDGVKRPVDERRASRNLDCYAAARRIIADDKLRGRKLRRLTEEVTRLTDRQDQLVERANDIIGDIMDFTVSSLEEIHRKVEFLSEQMDVEEFADVMLRDICRLKDIPHSTAPERDDVWEKKLSELQEASDALAREEEDRGPDQSPSAEFFDREMKAMWAVMLHPVASHQEYTLKRALFSYYCFTDYDEHATAALALDADAARLMGWASLPEIPSYIRQRCGLQEVPAHA